MRIIKLQVEKIVDKAVQLVKYAVSLDGKRYSKIGRFIAYIKKICKLDGASYQLELDGFILPNSDRTKALQENHVYRLKISHVGNRKDYLLRSSQVESSDEDAAEEHNKKKKSKENSNSEKGLKIQQKIAKMLRKKKEQKSSISSSDESSDSSFSDQDQQSSSSSSESLSEDSSSSSEETPKAIQKPIPKKQTKIVEKQPKMPVQIQPKKTNLKKPKSDSSSSSSSSSSSESEENLPTLQQQKGSNPVKPETAQKANLLANKAPVNPPININKGSSINRPIPQKKAVIADSSSESQPSEQAPVKKPAAQPKQVRNEAEQAEKPQVSKAKVDLKIPPALRNKIVKKNFDLHKENQWISIDKDSLKRWQQSGNKNVCNVNNKIRFKVVELDQEKFIPIKSGWISAEVKAINPESGSISLSKVEEEGKPYRQTLEIQQHNMDQLQINRLLATKQQIECFQQKSSQKQDEPPRQEKKQVEPLDGNGKNSVEKFVCGQANYYFSDKCYNFDLFMQLHANRHPEKYLNLAILLNFPKVKKVLRDVDKLQEYLRTDPKYDQRTYEIDFERRLIRKKGLVQPAPLAEEKPEETPRPSESKEVEAQAQQ